MGKAIAEVYWTLRGTRECRCGCVSVSIAVEFIRCLRSIPCLHAPEVYSRSDSCGGLGRACC